MGKKITKRKIKKELIEANQIENIRKEFLKVNKTDFRNFKSNLETKVSIIKEIEGIIKKKKKEVSILEIGAGYGDFSMVCLNLFKKKKIKRYMVTDLNKTKIALIKRNLRIYENVKVEKLDILYPKSFNFKYDIVIFSEVLEHLTTIEKELAFVNMNKFLNKGGYLIVSCPITEYVGRILFYSTLERVKLEYKTIRGHIAVPSITKIMGLFYRKGFDNIKIRPLPIILPFKRKIMEPAINVMEFFFKMLPRWFRVYTSPGVVVVGRKVSGLDDNWYNDINYLLEHLPSEKVSEGKFYETFVDYKYVKKK